VCLRSVVAQLGHTNQTRFCERASSLVFLPPIDLGRVVADSTRWSGRDLVGGSALRIVLGTNANRASPDTQRKRQTTVGR
jgi:hypothetical protein